MEEKIFGVRTILLVSPSPSRWHVVIKAISWIFFGSFIHRSFNAVELINLRPPAVLHHPQTSNMMFVCLPKRLIKVNLTLFRPIIIEQPHLEFTKPISRAHAFSIFLYTRCRNVEPFIVAQFYAWRSNIATEKKHPNFTALNARWTMRATKANNNNFHNKII